MTVKLKEKRTSIATVRDILRMFDTFPNPLLSRCRLPLSNDKNFPQIIYRCTIFSESSFFNNFLIYIRSSFLNWQFYQIQSPVGCYTRILKVIRSWSACFVHCLNHICRIYCGFCSLTDISAFYLPWKMGTAATVKSGAEIYCTVQYSIWGKTYVKKPAGTQTISIG